jgi:predicted dehydrogenase
MSNFRALIVGAGGMGRAWGRNLHDHPDVDIVGWVDIRPEAAQFAVDELKISGAYAGDDLGKALAETRPDFVVDVTIPEAHHDVTLQALAAGVPVLGEKPMATSMEQARAMVTASEHARRLYMVSQSRRYDPRIAAYGGLINQFLGPVGILKSDFFIGAHFGGFRDEMAHVLILDMAIHTFDAARYLTGADPVSVYCEEYNPGWSWYKGNASATALFDMTGGLRYLYTGSWCAEGAATSWESEWRAVGPHGTAIWDGVDNIKADVVVEHGGFHAKTETHYGHPMEMPRGIAGSLQEFLIALRTGQTPQGECHDNIKSLAMVFGAIESSVTGKRVEIHVR